MAPSPFEEGFGHRPVGHGFPGRFPGLQQSDAGWVPGERGPPLRGEREWIPPPGHGNRDWIPPRKHGSPWGSSPKKTPPSSPGDPHICPVF